MGVDNVVPFALCFRAVNLPSLRVEPINCADSRIYHFECNVEAWILVQRRPRIGGRDSLHQWILNCHQHQRWGIDPSLTIWGSKSYLSLFGGGGGATLTSENSSVNVLLRLQRFERG